MAALRDLEMMEDIFRRRGVCPESGGRIIFHSNMAKNGPI